MSEQQANINQLRTRFNILASQLGIANTHLHYFLRLEEARNDFDKSFLKAYDFWEYTKRAHLEIATFYLCRTYDENDAAEHLCRFLNEIPKDKLSKEEERLIQIDKKFCQKKSTEPLLVKLRHWRNNFGAHFNYRLTTHEGRMDLSGLKLKISKTPSDAELQQLICKGFEILERWASFYKSSPNFQRLIKDNDDYLFVLDAIHEKRTRLKIKNN